MSKIKRLYFDVEVSPNIGLFWSSGHKVSVGYENIVRERAIICICYKWQGERKVHSLTWDKGCDKKLLLKFIEVANTADELVGHNGDKFDLAWIRTRCLLHKIEMFPSYITTDTLKVARGKFKFNSNRLDYIGKFLGVGGKSGTTFQMWSDITLHNCKKSLDAMVKYCKRDVVVLENVYNIMAPHIIVKQRVNKDLDKCPECSSKDLRIKDRRSSVAGTVKLVIKCNGCGKHHSRTEKKSKSK